MKKIILFNTAVGSFNQGDYIIKESIQREFAPYLKNNYVVELGTHTPTCFIDQFRSQRNNELKKFRYGFVLGTNLFTTNRLHCENTWNFRYYNAITFPETILIGVGSSAAINSKVNFYTKAIYEKFFSHDFFHSVRDERTKLYLEKMGYKAINTGCATMWMLTKDHCKSITHLKSESVLFTLTDYSKSIENDKELLHILEQNYKKIFFWPQGSGDYEYLKSIQDKETKTTIISPNIDSLNSFLDNNECDYIGTRLHAGLKALQKKKRSLILSVDNRAEDIKQTYNIPIAKRYDYESIKNFISYSYETNINIDEESISKFKKQFDFLR